MAVYRDIDSDVRITGSLLLPSGSVTVSGVNIIDALAGKVATTTQVIAGTGLSGGGALSANRTLSITFGTVAGTAAEGNHAHTFASVTSKPTTLAGYGITDASINTHTHTFTSLTSRPTTLSGYGITDAATSTHNHNTLYLGLGGGTLTGALRLGGILTHSSITTGNMQVINTNGTTLYFGNPATKLLIESETNPIANVAGVQSVLWHAGNFTPADKADASALTTHVNNADIHKSWGKWATSTNGQDLLVDGKRAIAHPLASNKLQINYMGDFANGVEVTGALTNNGNAIWHAGNLSPSNFVTTGTGQFVGSGFSVRGRLLVGNVSGATGDAILYDDNSNATIHLDGNSSGIESSSATKIHLLGNGNAMFKETVMARTFTANERATIPSLTVTSINDVSERNFTKNDAIADNTGWGVLSGLQGVAYGGELHVDPGIAYTKSGRRIESKIRQKVGMVGPPVGGTRYDVLYMKGPSAATEEGNLHCQEGVVGQTALQSATNPMLSDGVVLATVKREPAQASITQSDIDSTVRDSGTITGRKPLYLDSVTQNLKVRYEAHASSFKEKDKYLNEIYATLAGGNTFTSNQKFNGRIHISTTGSLDGSATSANYGLRVGRDASYIAFDENEIISTSNLFIDAQTTIELWAPQGITLNGAVKAAKNAQTLTIPAGQTSVTWTHNYGTASYAVNLTSSSFERHIRWTNKTATTVTIELDDPSGQETLVDCILIGY